MYWSAYTVGNQVKHEMYCVIKIFLRKLLIGHLMFNLSHYHQHLLQQSIILFVFIVKYNSGWEEMFLQKNGGGKEVEMDLCLSEQILLQLQVNF